MMIIEIANLILSLISLGLIIYIYTLVAKQKEKFENCVGVQYNGLNFLDNPNGPICTKGIKSVYPDGGCLEYNPDQVAIDYMEGKFRPAV